MKSHEATKSDDILVVCDSDAQSRVWATLRGRRPNPPFRRRQFDGPPVVGFDVSLRSKPQTAVGLPTRLDLDEKTGVCLYIQLDLHDQTDKCL